MCNVLITGGTGFIGSRLALTYAERGDACRIFGLLNTSAEQQNHELLSEVHRVRRCVGDVLDRAALAEAMQGVDTVIHLAAAQHEAGKSDSHFQKVNVEGTRNVFDAAIEAGVSRVVYGSTIGVYRPGALVSDQTPLDPAHIYGRSKLAAERLIADRYLERIPTTIVRISETYGPHDRRLLKMFRAVAEGRWFHVGKSANLHQPIFVDDLVRVLMAAATREEAIGRTLIAAGSQAVTSREMAEAIAHALGVDNPTRTIPLAPISFVARMMEGLSKPLGITPPLHRRRLDFFVRSFRFDIEPTVAALNYKPATTFTHGAALTADWYTRAGLLALPLSAPRSAGG